MTDTPDFHDLVGDDLPDAERARLARVHDLLVEAGPPPELPPALSEPQLDRPAAGDSNLEFLPRRRLGVAIAAAAAVALVAFLGGYLVGHTKDFNSVFTVQMHGVPNASAASGTIDIGNLESSGNWPLKVVVSGLKPLPKGSVYEMYLTRHGKAVASCGTFSVGPQLESTIRLNAPYNLRTFNGWIVTREQTAHPDANHPVVLRTEDI
jgi:hypothetical protein